MQDVVIIDIKINLKQTRSIACLETSELDFPLLLSVISFLLQNTTTLFPCQIVKLSFN